MNNNSSATRVGAFTFKITRVTKVCSDGYKGIPTLSHDRYTQTQNETCNNVVARVVHTSSNILAASKCCDYATDRRVEHAKRMYYA